MNVVELPVVTTIGEYAFSNCTEINKAICPNVENIGNFAFRNCHTMSNIDFKKALIVGESAFSGCRQLTNVSLPLATEIGFGAFGNCRDLDFTINIPSAITIGESAFFNTSLPEISLPSATDIGSEAFCECIRLTKVDLPRVTSISARAFLGCTSLEAVIIRNAETVCAIDPEAFIITVDDSGNITALNDKFYIPASIYEAYRSAYAPTLAEYGFDGYFEYLFHKIEDHPEICGA